VPDQDDVSREAADDAPRVPFEDAYRPPLADVPATMPAEPVAPPPYVSMPEPLFAARIPPPLPLRPPPATRRAVFFDVENSSRPEHVERVLAHLRLDFVGTATELVAVGNWRVVGHETARILAQAGAHLVHSAPATGVRDWSDLRIAVAAGVWLAGARPGDTVEIITDDQAFDAVGDVASSLGVVFRRSSYRALAGVLGELPAPVQRSSESPSRSGRRRRRGGRGRARHEAPPPPPPAAVRNGGDLDDEAHTAPHDEIVGLVRELVARTADQSVTLDALSNALKSRGFRRTPGSPRLITRLRRIKELDVGRNGLIRLVHHEPVGAVAGDTDAGEMPSADDAYAEAWGAAAVPDSEGAASENGDATAEGATPAASPGRRRRRRGGRRRRGRGGRSNASATPPTA
jgi:hypothetical protein